MLSYLEEKIASGSATSDTWRMVGRLRQKEGASASAIRAFEVAIELEADNAAAHHDLGLLKRELNDGSAEIHFQKVLEFAPQSEYATALIQQGLVKPPPSLSHATPSQNAQASFEPDFVQGSKGNRLEHLALQQDLLEPNDESSLRPSSRIFVDFGSVFNSNIAVTPISRNITASGSGSFQAYVAPNIDIISWQNNQSRFGPVARGFFTMNEGDFENLNLASFQPGVFFERDVQLADREQTFRLEYVYSLDLLGGQRFGDRHGLTLSTFQMLENLDVLYGYVSLATSDFDDDGLNPAVDSLDGPALSLGVARFLRTDWTWLPTWSLGSDLEWARTTGQDNRYFAATVYTDCTFQLSEKYSLVPRASVGLRHYPDFTGAVARDETVIRLGGKLNRQLSENSTISVIFGHDRFASANEDFDVEKTEAGIVFSFLR